MGPSPQPMRQVSPEGSRVRSMAAAAPQEEGFSITLDDVYHIVFKHKLKIIVCAVVGLVAAGVFFSIQKPTYISEARLYVRFVVVEGLSAHSDPDDPVKKSPDRGGETIMSSEQEIASSFDLLKQVAQVIGPERILKSSGGGNDVSAAAMVIRQGLNVWGYGSIIGMSFQHADYELVQPVLREVIAQYLKKHTEIHHSSGIVGDILSQETDTLRARLATTEDELRKAKSKAGVVSVEDAKKTNSLQVSTIRQEIFAAEAQLAEALATYQEVTRAVKEESPIDGNSGLGKSATTADTSPVREPEIPREVIDAWRTAAVRVETLRQQEQSMLLTYTPESQRVKDIHTSLVEAQTRKQEIERANARLLVTVPISAANVVGQAARPGPDPATVAAQINALKAKIKVLNSQIDTLRAEAATLGQLEGNIQDLMRKRDLEEANYRRYAASSEQSRINEALGSGKVSNISQIQTPSTPAVAERNKLKIPGGLAAGGLIFGLVWSFALELFLDQSARRPVDVEKKLKLPLFLSIPDLRRDSERRPKRFLNWRKRKELPMIGSESTSNNKRELEPVSNPKNADDSGGHIPAESLQPFHETLRDRLISYCESQNLTRKPKLIAVTGLGRKSGVTTTAAGLARTLSETGEGNVLLVDLTSSQGSAMQFLKGSATPGLDELLDSKDNVQVQQNLYVVTDSNNSEQLSRNLPRRFTKLIPKIKASDFDYVVFDMPPVSQLSITPRLAGFMDIVLFVIESEKTNLDMVKRATLLLGQSKAHVGAILNKTHNYVPQRLHQDNLSHF